MRQLARLLYQFKYLLQIKSVVSVTSSAYNKFIEIDHFLFQV